MIAGAIHRTKIEMVAEIARTVVHRVDRRTAHLVGARSDVERRYDATIRLVWKMIANLQIDVQKLFLCKFNQKKSYI